MRRFPASAPRPAQPTLNFYRELTERWLGHRVEGRVQEVTLNRGWLHNVSPADTAKAIRAFETQEAGRVANRGKGQ